MCLLVMFFGVTYIALSKIFYPSVIKHYLHTEMMIYFNCDVLYAEPSVQGVHYVQLRAAPMSLQVDVPLVFQCLDSSLEVPF